MPVSKEVLDEIALSREEYGLIVQKLGREPTPVELGMFGALWSEHCGYKHSKALLSLFPTSGKRVLIKIGEENAGAVDIGDGQAIVFKMESHNHPSAIEPFQGAATGVGGIVRDIFTMGARPIALMNSLRFGPFDKLRAGRTDGDRNRYLFNGVVGGIGSYGNCLGIPDVGGEIYFSPVYSNNPLVNAFCLGIVDSAKLVKAKASGTGNLLLLVGSDTGRDGLHGASGLASRTFEEERELRSAVQVGNPFLEKLLIEACLELAQTDWIVGINDLGAAGLTSAAVESAGRGGSGIELDVLKVPRREAGMTPYEVMLSESQERMLVVARKGCEDKVKALFRKWDLEAEVIGSVTDDGLARIKEGSVVTAEVPVAILNEPPKYTFQVKKPAWITELQSFDFGALPDVSADDCNSVLLRLLASPDIASKEPVYRQYDHQVGDNTVIAPGSGDAAVLRIQGTKKAIAMTCDGNGRYCYVNPRVGGEMVIAEAARNLACVGAEPLAITDCLNFGNPDRPDIYYQLKECVRGIAHACRRFGIPVISGNVSLYNETRGLSIYPTPVVGMVGLLEDVSKRCTSGFKHEGDVVYLLGGMPWGTSGLAGSEYLELVHGKVCGQPYLDMDLEIGVQKTCREAIKQGLLHSAHDCSDGGLAAAMAESAIAGGLGMRGERSPYDVRRDVALFGESPSRIVVSLPPGKVKDFEGVVAGYGAALTRLGVVGGDRLVVPGLIDLSVVEMERAWRGGLGK
ncbi:MAG: phosphoribosylformylglycinamidine synthase subunit PurL [Chloroflexi bacterium]|nr:phosphoribosylformylglycinamidine synthase subunit PurL [Chloroflexota bacterium]